MGGLPRLFGRSPVGPAFVAVLLLGSTIALADTQQASGSGEDINREYGVDYNGQDITRPVNNFETRFEYRTSGISTQTDEQTLILRWDGAAKLAGGWKFGWLAELPLVAQTMVAPDGTQDLGTGDVVVQGILSQPINDRWAYGFGARLVAPTAQEELGSGRWQVMPGVGIRYSFLEFGPDTYFVPKIRYAIGFGGDPSRRDRNEPQIAPTLNIGLPARWFLTLYPSYDIRINYGQPAAGQTGRLFLPFDAMVGRMLTDNLIISFEVGVPLIRDYPVYNFKAELRLAYEF